MLFIIFCFFFFCQAVASKLHGQDVEVNIIKRKGDDCDHVQFEINERVKSISVSEPEKDLINFDQLMSFENKISPFTFCKAFPFHMVFDKNMILRQVRIAFLMHFISLGFTHFFCSSLSLLRYAAISPPFTSSPLHQAGISIARVLPAFTESECRITDAMEMIRPHMDFTFNNILAHINTVFVLRSKFGSYNENGKEFTR